MQNLAQVDYCRTSASVASGCAAGILGLTGIWGFLFYFLSATLVSVSLVNLVITGVFGSIKTSKMYAKAPDKI